MANKVQREDVNETERGFICRVFFARAGLKMHQTYAAARSYGVEPEWFEDATCRIVWKAADELFREPNFSGINLITLVKRANRIAKESKDPDESTVKVQLSFFEDSAKFVSSNDDIKVYAKEIQDALMRRKSREAMTKTIEEMASGDDTAMALSRLITSAKNILETRNPSRRMSISDLCDKALRDWDEAHHQRFDLGNYEWCPGLPLPWRKLSYCLNGFTPDITILAARPGVGKTSMALNFSRFWLDSGLRVVFVSVDMSPIGFVKRQLSERSRISSRKLQFGKSDNYDQERAKVLEQINVLKDLEKTGKFTLLAEYDVDNILATCSIMKDQGEIDVLIVDYLQLLTFKGAEKVSTTAKTTYISNTLHQLANSLQIPVLCLSQLNRDTTKEGGREPQLSDLRDSGAIEQDAANVLLLHRHDSLFKKWKESEPPLQFCKDRMPTSAIKSFRPIYCIVAKAREGDEGTKLPFIVNQAKYSWYLGDYEAEGDAQFNRVYDDWRHDPVERIWEENGTLIRMADIRAREVVEINADRQRLGMPPIVLPGEQMPLSNAQTPSVANPSLDEPFDDSVRDF